MDDVIDGEQHEKSLRKENVCRSIDGVNATNDRSTTSKFLYTHPTGNMSQVGPLS